MKFILLLCFAALSTLSIPTPPLPSSLKSSTKNTKSIPEEQALLFQSKKYKSEFAVKYPNKMLAIKESPNYALELIKRVISQLKRVMAERKAEFARDWKVMKVVHNFEKVHGPNEIQILKDYSAILKERVNKAPHDNSRVKRWERLSKNLDILIEIGESKAPFSISAVLLKKGEATKIDDIKIAADENKPVEKNLIDFEELNTGKYGQENWVRFEETPPKTEKNLMKITG